MKMIDLFSGIGGFTLAAQWAGIETVAFCEKDQFCQKILKKHWHDIPIVDDIRKLGGDEFGAVDIISGGFPCQPFSNAGERRGQADDRYLWPEMLRVIKTARPAWVIGENVAGFVPMGLDRTLADLEGTGYETRAFMVPAATRGAWHKRDRIWILAYSEEYAKRGLPVGGNPQISGPGNGSSHGGREIYNTMREGLQDWTAQNLVYDRPHQKLERSDRGEFKPGLGGMDYGLPDWVDGYWKIEPNIPRLANGVKNRIGRLKGLGNAIVPQIAYEFFRAIVEIEKNKCDKSIKDEV